MQENEQKSNTEQPTTESLETVARMARFENLFHKDNLTIGLQVWLRTTVPMLLIGIVLSATGIFAVIPDAAMLGLTALNFFLFQWAAAIIATKRYKMRILPTAWWSIYWRLVLFLMPVFMVLIFQAYPDMTEQTLRDNPEPLEMAMMIVHVLSIIPMGLVTSKALLISQQRLSTTKGDKPEA